MLLYFSSAGGVKGAFGQNLAGVFVVFMQPMQITSKKKKGRSSKYRKRKCENGNNRKNMRQIGGASYSTTITLLHSLLWIRITMLARFGGRELVHSRYTPRTAKPSSPLVLNIV